MPNRRSRLPTRRNSLRIAGFNYARPGWYFITINAKHWQHRFASCQSDAVVLSREGEIITETWLDIPNHHTHVRIDAHVVMPNHFHGLLCIETFLHTGPGLPRTIRTNAGSLAAIIRSFKSAVTRRIHRELHCDEPIWHHRFHERIIGSDEALNAIRCYIANNPAEWIRRCR